MRRCTPAPHIARRKPQGIFFLTDGQNLSLTRQKERSPGGIVFFAPGSEHFQRSHTAMGWGAMSLNPDDLAAVGRAIVGRDVVAPASDRLMRPPPLLMDRLLHLHKAAEHLAATVPDVLVHPEVARAIEQELVRVMICCLETADGTEARSGQRHHMPII